MKLRIKIHIFAISIIDMVAGYQVVAANSLIKRITVPTIDSNKNLMPERTHFLFSKHALEQINHRGLSKDTIEMIIRNPDHIFPDSGDVDVLQKLVKEEDKHYLYRVFVNKIKNPPVIITAYKTSKTDKYEDPV